MVSSTLDRVVDPTESFAKPRVAAGVLFLDDQSRGLLVHPIYKDTCDVPGGYLEQGKSPAPACARSPRSSVFIEYQGAYSLSSWIVGNGWRSTASTSSSSIRFPGAENQPLLRTAHVWSTDH